MLEILTSSSSDGVSLFKRMALVRSFEERLLDMFSQGLLMGTTHTCIGQEANAVGVVSALRSDDVVVSNHRCHGHFLAHVGDMPALMAEIMGRVSGVCGGWGGSQHLCVPGRFYSNGIQGGTLPMAAGLALAHKKSGSDKVVVVFIGDGTLGQGVVYETLNIASLLSLPMLCVVEDNQIAQSTPAANTLAGNIGARAEAFGIGWQHLENPLVEDIFTTAKESVAQIRSGGGPRLLWLDSVRLGPHSKGDDTRPQAEIDKLRLLDPLARGEEQFSPEVIAGIWAEAKKDVDGVVAKAVEAPWPQLSNQEKAVRPELQVTTPVVDDAATIKILRELSGKSMLVRMQDALRDVVAASSDVLLFGEDIADPYGGAFKVTEGLSSSFPQQVMGMPISEGAMVGLAGGLALGGKKPIVEIMFGDFLGLAMDQLINHAARFRGMYNSQVEVPMVVRTPMGGGRGYGPTHSQTLDKHFLGIPGLNVLAPSPLHPLSTMLQGALTAKNPTLWIENKIAYAYRTTITDSAMVDDFYVYFSGDPAAPWLSLSHTGFDDDMATIVTYGGMLSVAMSAASTLLMDHEIATRVLLPSCLFPFDRDACLRLLASLGPVLLLEEGALAFGFGSEVLATLAQAGGLNGRGVGRVGMEGSAIPASKVLEEQCLPGANAVVECMLGLIKGS
ncbi:MAG: pyruvate dehydrogenase [Magnetococcales bacterium]|nr:pyruvate dehydrogenase [Magnetococcales bacterium]